MGELGFKSVLALEVVSLAHHLGVYHLHAPAAACKLYHSPVSNLELHLVSVGDEVAIAQRVHGREAQHARLHHRAEQARGGAFRYIGVACYCGRCHLYDALRREVLGKHRRKAALHRREVARNVALRHSRKAVLLFRAGCHALAHRFFHLQVGVGLHTMFF